MDEYRPQMSAERVQRLRQWHQEAAEELRRRGAHDVHYLGLDLHVPEQVFSPTPTSDLLGNEVRSRARPGDRVLDMGCGAGANAILAAQITDQVVAVDVNPLAVEATRANAERNEVQSFVTTFHSDLFEHVDGDFDLIVFDPPFRWFHPRDLLERAVTDENYRSLARFMDEAASRLRPGGEVLVFFGTSGDIAYLDRLVDRAGLASEVVAERTHPRAGRRCHLLRATSHQRSHVIQSDQKPAVHPASAASAATPAPEFAQSRTRAPPFDADAQQSSTLDQAS